jgi:DNA modification methylase
MPQLRSSGHDGWRLPGTHTRIEPLPRRRWRSRCRGEDRAHLCPPPTACPATPSAVAPSIARVATALKRTPAREDALADVDWAFLTTPDAHALHGLHPYPAKFVPALPRVVIERLTEPGDLVMDPFAGSGTALVEALLLGRRAVGGDLNPVAIVTSRAKSRRLTPEQLRRLDHARDEIPDRVTEALSQPAALALPADWEPTAGRRFRGLSFWFSREVALELAALKAAIAVETDEACRSVLDMCLSSIVVSVSWQDSDTRYVRRAKKIEQGYPTSLYLRRLATARAAIQQLSAEASFSSEVFMSDARTADYADEQTVRLIVTSPPYPNAWSYHLYHQNRILWLDHDPWAFKDQEIGHHRAYSATGGSGESDFKDDMHKSMEAMKRALQPDGRIVIVVGDSIVRGAVVRNDAVVMEAGINAGLTPVAAYNRFIDPKRKAFNPSIGKIKTEHILVFRR